MNALTCSLIDVWLMIRNDVDVWDRDLNVLSDHAMVFDNLHYFSRSIFYNHHDWHFWFCYLRLATSDSWIDRDERIRINWLSCRYLMLMFSADLKTSYSSDLLRELSRRKFSNSLSSADILRRTCEIFYLFLFVLIVCMFLKSTLLLKSSNIRLKSSKFSSTIRNNLIEFLLKSRR